MAPRATTRRPTGVSRPALVGVLIVLYLILGIVLVFLGLATLFIGTRADVIALGVLVFVGNGVLSFLTVYGLLKGGRWAPRYIALTGLCCLIGGVILAISLTFSLLAVGSLAIGLGAVTLVYLRSSGAKEYLNR